MTVFFLVRHGETEWSLNEKYKLKGGYRDLPSLTESGIKQAEYVSSDSRFKNADLILSSPYTRALQTAAIISKNTGLDIIVEYNLREWQPSLDLTIDNKDQLQNAINDYEMHNGIYPPNIIKNWESKISMKKRLSSVLQKYLKHNYVIVVSHEQLIKTHVSFDKISHCSVNELKIT